MTGKGISELRVEGNVAVLTIDNGPKNLLSEPEFADRRELLGLPERYPQAGALIITGKGRHFSHGADVSLFGEADSAELSAKLEGARELLSIIENLPLITAAAINGGCFGGGLEIALSCQFRIASPSAFLGLPEVTHGVMPGMGGTERLCRLIGREKALAMILGGDIIGSGKALGMGLITGISRDRDAFGETMAFVKSLMEGKSISQIRAVAGTAARAAAGVPDPSKGSFEALLAEVREA